MSAANTDHYVRNLSGLANSLPGHELPWLRRTRQQALQRFSELGFPTTRQEDWKYTNVRPIEKRGFQPATGTLGHVEVERLAPHLFQDLNCHRLVFVNGHYVPDLSWLGTLPSGVTIGNIGESLILTPGGLERHLGRYASPDANGFAALNAAQMADGAYIYVAAGQVVEEPIHVLFLATGEDESLLTQPRNLLIAGDHSQAVIIESYASLKESHYLTNAVTEVVLGKNAQLEHYKLQQESTQAYHVATLQVHQDRDSRFTSHSVAFGARIARNDINSVLDAEGAECTLNGLYMVDGRQHVDFHTRVDHSKPRGVSREFYKGILDGYARGVFNGRVYVHPHAQHTDAEQSNKNLLLSPNAEVDTKPQLEIYADDVKCSHGATVGQLDERMLFYLRSRGIDQATAHGMLTYGFAHDLVEQMGLAPIRARLEDWLVNRLPEAAVIKGIR